MSLKRFILSFVIALAAVGFFALPALAQIDTGIEEGSAFQQALGLGTADPKIIVANVIRAALGLLGVVAVCLFIYAGFLWMTSGGSEEKVDRARKMLINATVGLTIILASFAITQFVLSRLLSATGVGGSDITGGGGTSGGAPASTDAVFVIESASPQGEQTIKNLTVRLTFNKDVDGDTVSAITITPDGSSTPVEGTYAVNGDRVTFTPSLACEEAPSENCFAENTLYTIELGSGLKSESGLTISCGGLYDACEYEFTSGELVDTTDPEVEITYPEDGDSVSVDAYVPLQALVTDDAGVSLVEFYVDGVLVDTDQPDGDTPTEFIAEIEWDTAAIEEGSEHEIYAIAYDVNAHDADSDAIEVTVRAAHCFNGETDEDETGEDCGGEDCGSCGGDACVEDSDCQSGVCEDGSCVDAPEITGVSPADGAPGTYVTISGNNFGSSTGTVLFGDVEAELADCNDPWDTDQVIVVVPEGVSEGELYTITLTTAGGHSDSTDDDNGTLIDDFEVTSVVRPGICQLDPDFGEVTDPTDVLGVNFGDAQDSGAFYFGTVEAGAYTDWADELLSVIVPTLAADDYDATVWIDGVESNTVNYEVQEADTGAAPVITSIDPESGPIDEYVTIVGENFGSSTGLVYFTNTDTESADFGVVTAASTDFPAVCVDDIWGGEEIIVKVPEGVESTTYSVNVYRYDSVASEGIDFTVTDGTAGPGICAIDPDSGPSGYEGVTISGEGFGDDEGTVTFADGQSASVTTWEDGEIVVDVPEAAVTGYVTVTDTSDDESNGTLFGIGDCNEVDLCDANTQQCCSTGVCVASTGSCPEETVIDASYAWRFSTGPIPTVPGIEVECSDDMISPTPWDGRSGGDAVCVNAALSATFDTTMDQDSFTSTTILLNKCTGPSDDPCSSVESVTLDTIDTTSVSFTVAPASVLDVSSTYLITLTSGITSYNGTAIEETAWTFGTSSSAEICDIEGVNITPSSQTIEEEDGTANFNAQAVAADECVILDSGAYAWNWETDETYATLTTAADADCTGEPSSCQSALAVQEGTSYMLVEENTQGVDDDADLLINFTNPYIVSYEPSCGEGGTACINAGIYVTFNTEMDESSITSPGRVVVYPCTDEICAAYTDADGIELSIDLDDDDPTQLSIIPTSYFTSTTYYEVILSGDIASESGVLMSETYDGDFSWTFLTKADDTLCAVDRVALDPGSATVDYVGATAVFESRAYGLPDACSSEGQQLVGTSYDWAWVSDNTAVATLYSDGAVEVATDEIPDGCTTSCLPEGTQSYTAICGEDADGDGSLLDSGEDCDDGNAEDGDGCSSQCLNEGTTACTSATDPSCCGNGTVDAAEECDDGGSRSGDGCSASCLNEGSRSVGLSCTDNVLTHYDTVGTTTWAGGEECNDEDDGCSSVCLNEGSPSNLDLVGVCGNGVVESPAEECDGGARCSDTCLFEGNTTACSATVTTNCCGNSTTESSAFESCDDGNTTSGDGCSNLCLLEGSSALYTTPSFCADATVGLGEASACEVSTSDLDGNVEPIQVAIIATTAPAEVVDGVATSTIEATTEGETGEAAFNLSCSCTVDSDCSDSTTLGCGTGGCCYVRPTVTDYTPSTTDACRNTLISFTFDAEMNINTFAENVSVELELDADETCPYDGSTARANGSWFSRLWNTVTDFFTGFVLPADAQSSVCELPFTFSVSDDAGGQRVSLIYTELLEASHDYTVTITGDPDHDGSGVRSADGVGMQADYTFTAEIGEDVCSFDAVRVEDEDEDSPGLFTETNEEHSYHATAITTTGGVEEELSSIPGVYEWDWTQTWWSTDTEILTVPSTSETDAEGDDNVVTAVGENGEAVIYADALITVDTLFGLAGESVAGSVDAVANLCENPWPALPTADELAAGGTWEPFTDEDGADADPDDDGTDEIAERDGYMHFSTYYCRDDGDEGGSDDFDSADAVGVTAPPGDVLKEYLFRFSNGDGIGIRISPNEDLLAIGDWYAEQGFTGSPSATTVDGYEALQDGRTVYVLAANQSDDGDIYSNIYVLSYSEGADESTVEIFNQMLENWSFNTNVSNDQLCYETVTTATEVTARIPICNSATSAGYQQDCVMDCDDAWQCYYGDTDEDGYCDMVGTANLRGEGAVCGDGDYDCSIDCSGSSIGFRTGTVTHDVDSLEISAETCSSDFDCSSGPCSAEKDKLTRDLKRLTDLRYIEGALENYGESNGRCSASTSISCTSSADCPSASETCEPVYPEINSGSFLRSITDSAWSSWTEVLQSDLEVTIPTDPLNQFDLCGETGGDYADYSADTCWNATNSLFACPAGSYTYLYRNIGQTAYQILVDLEYDYVSASPTASWAFAIDQDTTDDLDILVGNAFDNLTDGYQEDPTCNDDIYGASEVCGDGVRGSGEACEAGDTQSVACTALVCVSRDADYDGQACLIDCTDTTICSGGDADADGDCDSGLAAGLACNSGAVDCTDTTICTTTASESGTTTESCIDDPSDALACDDYETNPRAACVPVRCGNGVVDAGETCDDGSRNGTYGYCGTNCAWDSSAFYCGDGTLAGGESCDEGSDNGVYTLNPANSCNATCSGTGPSCGDGKVNGAEICDGDNEQYEGALCSDGETACDDDSDCSGTDTCHLTYDSSVSILGQHLACPTGNVCVGGSLDGVLCNGTSWADVGITGLDELGVDLVLLGLCQAGGGTCDTTAAEYQTYRTRSCDEDATSATACQWNSWNYCNSAEQMCGDGEIQGEEECDDGNSSNNDACTNACTSNVCGDGYLYSGYETCDRGDENGTICEADYGSTCRYCSNACVYLTASGDYCGDGVLDTSSEVCDGTLTSHYYYFDSATRTVNGICYTLGDTLSDDGVDYTCRDVGVCDGGPDGGEYCTYSAGESVSGNDQTTCDTNSTQFYTCMKPTCNDDCASACPFNYEEGTVSITSESAGAVAGTSLSLYSFENDDGNAPDNATLTLPACTVWSSLTADISESERNLPDTDIIFVLDKSQSMSSTLSGSDTRLDILRSAVSDAVDELFDAYTGVSAELRVGVAYIGGQHGTDGDSSGTYSQSELNDFLLLDLTDEKADVLQTLADDFRGVDSVQGTPIYESVADAIDALSDSTAESRIIIVFTDGDIYNTSTEYGKIQSVYGLSDSDSSGSVNDEYMAEVSQLTDDAKDSGIEIYSAVLTSTTCDIRQMQRWSSMVCTTDTSADNCSGARAEGNDLSCTEPDSGLTYAYSATTADELAAMYEQIIDSILGVTVIIVDEDGNEGMDLVDVGDSITLPLPSAFICDETAEKDVSIKVSFRGSGPVKFEAFELNMCAP